jgi:hypothetical protein
MADADDDTYTDAVNYLAGLGWTVEQAQGLLERGLPRYSGDRAGLFHDYCGARELDPSEIAARLHFLHDELTGPFAGIGQDVRAAQTAARARQAFEPYFDANWPEMSNGTE